MAFKFLKRGIIGALLFIILGIVAALIYIQNEIDHVLGGNTVVVSTENFKSISGKIAIVNAKIWTPSPNTIIPSQIILINGQKIEAIGSDIEIPPSYNIIDASDKYVIPGLIDAHVHLKKSKNDLLLYLANGITHIGEMTGMDHHFRWKQEIREGAPGPDIYLASPKMNSLGNLGASLKSRFEKRSQNYPTVESAKKAVRDYYKKGYDAIKISTFLKPEIYLAITEEASDIGIPTIGHIPFEVSLEEFFRSSQSQLGHVSEITKDLEKEYQAKHPIYFDHVATYLEYIRTRADSIAIELKKQEIVVASTIWLHKSIPDQDFNLPKFLKTIELAYMNPGWVEGSVVSKGWLPGNSHFENPENTDAEGERLSAIYWNTQLEAILIVVEALSRNGVKLMAGTDANGADGVIPGFSLHDELNLLSRKGMSVNQVLKAATRTPAEWMQIDAGEIQVGFEADLLILNKNPLEDVRHLHDIHAVMANGKYYGRATLDNMLEAVKDANNESRKISIDEYLN